MRTSETAYVRDARYIHGTFKAHGMSLACHSSLNLARQGCKIHSWDIQGSWQETCKIGSCKKPWEIPVKSLRDSLMVLQGVSSREITIVSMFMQNAS